MARRHPIFFPVKGKHNFTDTWGAARADTGTHKGTDIFAARGTPVVAVVNGKITKMGPSQIGGNRIWVNGTWYYAHLDAFAKGLKVGSKVRAGQIIGYVGDTGDAKGTPTHLHFGWDPHGTQGLYWENPYSTLLRGSVTAPPNITKAAKVAQRTSSDSGGGLDQNTTYQPADEGSPYPLGYAAFQQREVRVGSPRPYSDNIRELWGTVIQNPNLSSETRALYDRLHGGM